MAHGVFRGQGLRTSIFWSELKLDGHLRPCSRDFAATPAAQRNHHSGLRYLPQSKLDPSSRDSRFPGASRDNKVTPHSLLGDPPSFGASGCAVGRQNENGQVLSAQLPTRLALCGHCRCDHNQYRSNRNCDQPTDPINPWAAVATERGVDVPADDDTSDAAQDGEPEWDVVPATRSNELAEQANNDARDNHSDDLHMSS